MKKICLILLLLISVYIKPVNADMSGPEITYYKVRVNELNGTTLFSSGDNENIHVSYDTILEVVFEKKIDGIVYGEVEYNGDYYYFNLSDVELVTKNVNISNWEKHKPREMYVYKEGVYLYNGPSKTYGKIIENIEIPVGTTISFEYSDDLWAYVTYNGYKGWVYIYPYEDFSPYEEGSGLAEISEGSFYTFDNITLTQYPDGGADIVSVPAFSIITYKYYYESQVRNYSYYFEYNGKSGWYTKNYKIGTKLSNDVTLMTTNDVSLYSSQDNESKIISIIPKNKEISVIYEAMDYGYLEGWLYVEYKGQKGWVYYSDYDENVDVLISSNIFETDYDKLTLLDNVHFYDNIFGNLTDKVLFKDSVLTVLYSYGEWYYVKNDNSKGWIHLTNYEENDNEDFIPETNDQKVTEEKEEVVSEEKLPKMSTKEITIYCIIGSLILTLVSIVTIKLINKKRKSKNNINNELGN